MARGPREVNNRQDSHYHIPLRAIGTEEDRPFGPAERKHFLELLEELKLFYVIRIVNVAFLGNHVHLVLRAPARPPRRALVIRFWRAYYRAVKTRRAEPDWNDPEVVGRLALAMRDISHFIKQFKQRSAVWFNHSRPVPRRGSLWCNRFKSVLVRSTAQLLTLMRYVDLNPARAGMAAGPLAGPLNVPGAMAAGGSAFGSDYLCTLRSCWDEPCRHLDDAGLLARYLHDLQRILAGERGSPPGVMDRYVSVALA
jgi:REP element-mobilizing transposase RayT